ncbi:MAG: FAD:protein FMN transferase [Ectobacillus sp.]
MFHYRRTLSAGGDIALIGTYTIGIAHPFQAERDIARIEVENASIAISGISFRTWKQEDRQHYHFVDGRTGEMAESGAVQATVIAHTTL